MLRARHVTQVGACSLSFLFSLEMNQSRVQKTVCLDDSVGGEEGGSPLILSKSTWIGVLKENCLLQFRQCLASESLVDIYQCACLIGCSNQES